MANLLTCLVFYSPDFMIVNILHLVRKQLYAVAYLGNTTKHNLIPKYSIGSWEHDCAGSIISKNVVISAAHCFDGSDRSTNNTYVGKINS